MPDNPNLSNTAGITTEFAFAISVRVQPAFFALAPPVSNTPKAPSWLPTSLHLTSKYEPS